MRQNIHLRLSGKRRLIFLLARAFSASDIPALKSIRSLYLLVYVFFFS
jgi:hypothetical protein